MIGKKMSYAAVVVIAAFAFAGCSAPEPTGTPTATKEAATPSPSAEASDPMAFCQSFADGMQDYASFILDSASADVNLSVYKIQLSRMQAMEEEVPAAMKATLAQYSDPVYQIKEVVDAGGGDINFTTDGFKNASLEIMQYCVDEGFQAS